MLFSFCLLLCPCPCPCSCPVSTRLTMSSLPSLLMYGCMALMNEKYEEAETFFEAATCAESKNVIAWTMLGNYYIESLNVTSVCIHVCSLYVSRGGSVAAWSARWTHNPEVLNSSSALTTGWICFSVVPSSIIIFLSFRVSFV